MAHDRKRTSALAAVVALSALLAGCSAPSPQGAPTGEYAPVPDLVTTEEVTFRESFEMSPEDTHEYWSDPTIFNNADTFNYTSPDGAIGEQSADRPTGAYIEPTDGMEIGENGNGPGDVATAGLSFSYVLLQAAAKASADLEAAEAKIAEQAAADKAAATDRRSVFDRFTGDSGSSPAPSHSAQSANTGFSAATGYLRSLVILPPRLVLPAQQVLRGPSLPESDDANASLEERLLDRMRSGGFSLAASSPEELRDGETGAAAASETSAISEGSASEAAADEPHTLGEAVAGTAGVREEPEGSESDLGTGVPRASKSAQEWTAAEDIESEYDADDLQEDKGHGVLMTLIGILIGIVLGIIVGFGLRYLYVNVLSLGEQYVERLCGTSFSYVLLDHFAPSCASVGG